MATFQNNNALNKEEVSKALEEAQKEMLEPSSNSPRFNSEEQFVLPKEDKERPKSPSFYKQKAPVSIRIDDDMLTAINLLVDELRFIEGKKSNVNLIINEAIKTYLSIPENKRKIKKMVEIRNLNNM